MSTWALRENLKRPQDPALKPSFDEVLTLPSHVDNCDQGEAGNDFWGFNSLGYGVLRLNYGVPTVLVGFGSGVLWV